MKISRLAATTALGLAMALASPFAAAAQEQKAASATAPAEPDTTAPDSAEAPVVEPEALAALKRMSAFLMSLKTFKVTINSALDVVTNDGQRIQMDSVARYSVKRPGMVVELESGAKTRRYFYDGKQFTALAPKLGFYATIPAPPTNPEMLDKLHDDYGISIPLEDLFRWNDDEEAHTKLLVSGFAVGTAMIDGVATDHYAFRQKDLDWEVWIEPGEQAVPRKFAIVDRTDPAQPGYTARLTWTLNPPMADADFVFVPGKDQMRINIATLQKDAPQSDAASEK